jgi:Flp pilus assembly protein TadB
MMDVLRNRAIVFDLVSPYLRCGEFEASRTKTGVHACQKRRRNEVAQGLFVGSLVVGLSVFVAPVAGVIVVLLTGGGRVVFKARVARARSMALERDLPALLNSVASSVRAGIDPVCALTDAREYLPPLSPLVAELGRFKNALASGVDEIKAIEELFGGDKAPDLELFTRCLILSRRHGSALSEPLYRVTRVVRQRQSFRRKTRAALAMHRMSAIGIALCAVCIGGLQLATNADGVRIAMGSSIGIWLLSSGVVLVAIGLVWMLMMGREERL